MTCIDFHRGPLKCLTIQSTKLHKDIRGVLPATLMIYQIVIQGDWCSLLNHFWPATVLRGRTVAINYERLIFPARSSIIMACVNVTDCARTDKKGAAEEGVVRLQGKSRPNKYPTPMSNFTHFKYFNYFTYKPRSSSLADAFGLKPLVSVTP